MLNRIRVRGKLFLLLTAPLLALLIFAYLGVVDRLDDSTRQGREERIAELADAGSDLSLSLAQERITGMLLDAGADADIDLSAAGDVTNQAMRRWIDSASDARPSLFDQASVEAIDLLAEQLTARVDRSIGPARSTTSLLAELSLMSRSIETINSGLLSEASDLDLYRAMFVQGFTGQMQTAATELAIVGANSIRSGEVSTVSKGILSRADGRLVAATVGFQEQVETRYLLALADLRSDGLIPRNTDGQHDTAAAIEEIIDSGDSSGVITWLELGLDRIAGIHTLSDSLLEEASATAALNATVASDSAQNFIILAGSVSMVALLMAVLIGRSISRPLGRLSKSARQLSDEELPALVESMRTGGRVAPPEMSVIESKGRDEVAQLSTAISEIQRVTVEVAEEQTELLHRGISEMFVNLARRNQSLLDRQIQFIDELETSEEDPDQLKNLFRLDHLATRMRRNAESLLVLAGGEPSRRRGEPVPLESVTRVAVSEIEDYSRVVVLSTDSAMVPSAAAVDLAHLLSELMENATQFSPPDTTVDVVGYLSVEGAYRITVADRGIGMSPEQISEANATLAEPPVVGLDMGRSLGFTVISRIAERLALTVRLTPTPDGGLTAVVTLPAAVLVEPPETDIITPDPVPGPARPGQTDLFGVFSSPRPVTSPDPKLAEDIFRKVASTPESTLPPPPAILPTAESPTPSGLPKRRPAGADAPPGREPVAGSVPTVTASGLARRVPKTAVPEQDPSAATVRESVSGSTRSPEEVREMLSRYRGGLQRGRGPSTKPDDQKDQSRGPA